MDLPSEPWKLLEYLLRLIKHQILIVTPCKGTLVQHFGVIGCSLETNGVIFSVGLDRKH